MHFYAFSTFQWPFLLKANAQWIRQAMLAILVEKRALRRNYSNPVTDPHCRVKDILIDAYENARFLSEQHFCVAPALTIECFNSKQLGQDIHVPLVPLHLYYIVFELLKVEKH